MRRRTGLAMGVLIVVDADGGKHTTPMPDRDLPEAASEAARDDSLRSIRTISSTGETDYVRQPDPAALRPAAAPRAPRPSPDEPGPVVAPEPPRAELTGVGAGVSLGEHADGGVIEREDPRHTRDGYRDQGARVPFSTLDSRLPALQPVSTYGATAHALDVWSRVHAPGQPPVAGGKVLMSGGAAVADPPAPASSGVPEPVVSAGPAVVAPVDPITNAEDQTGRILSGPLLPAKTGTSFDIRMPDGRIAQATAHHVVSGADLLNRKLISDPENDFAVVAGSHGEGPGLELARSDPAPGTPLAIVSAREGVVHTVVTGMDMSQPSGSPNAYRTIETDTEVLPGTSGAPGIILEGPDAGKVAGTVSCGNESTTSLVPASAMRAAIGAPTAPPPQTEAVTPHEEINEHDLFVQVDNGPHR